MDSHRRRLLLGCLAIVGGFGVSGGVAWAQSPLSLDGMPALKAGPPVDFGTAKETFLSVGEWEFAPTRTEQTYADYGNGGQTLLRYSTGGGWGFLAPVHVPDGAVLTSITLDFCDSSTMDQHFGGRMLVVGNVDGAYDFVGSPQYSTSNVADPCHAYTQDLSGLNFVVDSQTSRLAIIAVTPATDNTNALAGAIVGYKLQVSPAPGTATFNDVPTNHPFFQYVEALAKSGITGGCGNGNYCPDAPLTRGQMAVFLAKGLGLQWP